MDTLVTGMDRRLDRPWWRKPHWMYAGGLLAALLLGLVFVLASAPERSLRVNREQLTVATVTHGAYHDFIPLRARVAPLETVYLDAMEGGRVEKVFVEAGDHVTAGQELVAFSNTELELAVLDREARLIESITQLQAYQTQLEQNRLNNEKALATIEYDITRLTRSIQRRKALGLRGGESQEAIDAVQDELTYMQKLQPLQASSNEQQDVLRVQQTPQIQRQLEKLLRDVEITRSKLDNLLVRAPVDGRMTAIELKVGENRNRGDRLGEITPASGFKLTAAVDEYYLGRLRKGQSATAHIDNTDWPLQVTRVYPRVSNGVFEVDLIFLKATPQGLLPGQAVQGKFALGDSTSAIIVPVGPFLQESGGEWIFVVDPDGESAERRSIRAGRRNIEQLEILSGLKPGERVITSDYGTYSGLDRIDIAD